MPEKEKGRVSRRSRQFLWVCPRGDCAHPSHAPPQYGGQLCHCAPFAPCVSWQKGYVARHTWATLAFMSSVDMSVIAQALGHTDVKTTRIYVEDIGNGKQNSANKKLLDEVLKKRSSVQEVTSVQEVQQFSIY